MKTASLPALSFVSVLLFCGQNPLISAQIRLPQMPVQQGFQPVVGPANSYSSSIQYQSPFPVVQLGATASGIDALRRQSVNYHSISSEEQQQEVAALVNELRRSSATPASQPVRPADAMSAQELDQARAITARYYTALEQLSAMLDGKRPPSLADAFYIIEEAFGNVYLSKAAFQQEISRSASFIRKWMAQQGLNPADNDDLNLAIQQFMGEPLHVYKELPQTKGSEKTQRLVSESHSPFFYDYKDYQGSEDYRNFFATKCLATGSGQCNSMPRVYLCLAEALGAHTSLSFAPLHSLIRYQDKTGAMRNYEATSNWIISDQWYEDNMFISPEAVRSGIYLDTMTKEQMLAQCVYDLAAAYTWQCPVAINNGAFVYDCLQKARPYFPKYNNLTGLFLYSSLVKLWLHGAMIKYGITGPDGIEQKPEAAKYLRELAKNEAFIKRLGYQDMPTGMYDELLKEHEFKGKLQQAHGLDGKKKRSLFTKTGK